MKNVNMHENYQPVNFREQLANLGNKQSISAIIGEQ